MFLVDFPFFFSLLFLILEFFEIGLGLEGWLMNMFLAGILFIDPMFLTLFPPKEPIPLFDVFTPLLDLIPLFEPFLALDLFPLFEPFSALTFPFFVLPPALDLFPLFEPFLLSLLGLAPHFNPFLPLGIVQQFVESLLDLELTLLFEPFTVLEICFPLFELLLDLEL